MSSVFAKEHNNEKRLLKFFWNQDYQKDMALSFVNPPFLFQKEISKQTPLS